ncbi:DUF3343 domain-containing protein [Atopobacter sp. AH10]|uniref:DUF3343 domain-containing protein n=1 Tax=Atopobacter sp. AH10 TaxID=2315861 RepID=UPI001313DEB2|nr:DUF3343 domain-containing protein [Atopobacter sp. AH10]
MDLYIAFDSTHDAIRCENLVKEAQIKARLIPTPEHISAGCGLTLKARGEDYDRLMELIQREKLVNRSIFQVTTENGRKHFTPVKDD